MTIKKLRKRDGRLVEFDGAKIASAINKAFEATYKPGQEDVARVLAEGVVSRLEEEGSPSPDVEHIPHAKRGKLPVLGKGRFLAEDEIADRQSKGQAPLHRAELAGPVIVADRLAPDRAVGAALPRQVQQLLDILLAPGLAVGQAALLAEGRPGVDPVHHFLDRLVSL